MGNIGKQILPVAVGLVVYGLIRSTVNAVFTNFGFPFA